MIILIPMAGAGSRFEKAGYKISKPMIPTTDRKTGKKIPMVIAATKDVPHSNDTNNKIIYIDRNFHKESGVENEILKYYPNSTFITIDYLTEGQAATCMLAKDLINNDEELFIGACDNGMEIDLEKFNKIKQTCDALMISHTNDENIAQNPSAHSWAELKEDDETIKRISIKKTVSENPLLDHATTGAFWFKRGSDFVKAVEKMISDKDKTGGEYYVDTAVQYAIDSGLKTKVFDIKYICWGTPLDYENYENTLEYWTNFIKKEPLLK